MKRLLMVLLVCLTTCAMAAEPLTLSCTASPEEGAPPLAVRFACKASQPKATLEWTFGDGSRSAEANPAHTYDRIGNFSVQVKARAGAESATWSHTVRAVLKATVTVGSGGGAAELSFNARRGQTVRISMRAVDAGLEPYGHLESASGANYRPANETVQNGSNAWQGALPDDGRYVLTVFDGANQGGKVAVTVEEP